MIHLLSLTVYPYTVVLQFQFDNDWNGYLYMYIHTVGYFKVQSTPSFEEVQIR